MGSGNPRGDYSYLLWRVSPDGPVAQLDWEGTWADDVTYVDGDVVSYNGSSYRATGETLNEPPDINPLKWEVVAEKGEPGSPGSSPQAYVHDQGPASALWTVVHNLGYNPNVTIIDSGGTEVRARVLYVDLNTLQIDFNGVAIGGKAYCS